jgi:prepilin-type N-terminal cleavage/methylation domain-containing protein
MLKKLLNKNIKLSKNQKGLTLIELLVVIVILGIIAAIAIPAITSQRDKANESAAEQTNAVVKDAVQRFIATDASYTSGKVVVGDLDFQQEPTCPTGYTKATATTDLTTTNFCVE